MSVRVNKCNELSYSGTSTQNTGCQDTDGLGRADGTTSHQSTKQCSVACHVKYAKIQNHQFIRQRHNTISYIQNIDSRSAAVSTLNRQFLTIIIKLLQSCIYHIQNRPVTYDNLSSITNILNI